MNSPRSPRRGPRRRRFVEPIRTLNLGAVLEDALCMPAARFVDRIIECAFEIEHDLLVQTEPTAWCELLMALTEHSVRQGFGDRPHGGSIVISAGRLDADRVRVVYRDDGCLLRTGPGLGRAREIVRDRLRGTIAALPSAHGAAFEIDVPTLRPA